MKRFQLKGSTNENSSSDIYHYPIASNISRKGDSIFNKLYIPPIISSITATDQNPLPLTLVLFDRNNDDDNDYNHHYHKKEETPSPRFVLRIVVFRTLFRASQTGVPLEVVPATAILSGALLRTRWLLERVPPLVATWALSCAVVVPLMACGTLLRGSVVFQIGAPLSLPSRLMRGRRNSQRCRSRFPMRGLRGRAPEMSVRAPHTSMHGRKTNDSRWRGGLSLSWRRQPTVVNGIRLLEGARESFLGGRGGEVREDGFGIGLGRRRHAVVERHGAGSEGCIVEGYRVQRPWPFRRGVGAPWVRPCFAVWVQGRDGRAGTVVVAGGEVGDDVWVVWWGGLLLMGLVYGVEGAVVDGGFRSECCGAHCWMGDCER